MGEINNCQSRTIDEMSKERIWFERSHPENLIKYLLSKAWNRSVKPTMARFLNLLKSSPKNTKLSLDPQAKPGEIQHLNLQTGEVVRVKSKQEIEAMLDFEKKYHGCTFLDCMAEYCGTTQRVFRPVSRFLDERDFKFKKSRGIVLLEGVYCDGKLVFGQCDRSCFLFWREEWLERI